MSFRSTGVVARSTVLIIINDTPAMHWDIFRLQLKLEIENLLPPW